MDLKERDALGDQADSHWYYVSKAKMVTRYLTVRPREILDVGAGIGWFSRWLLRNGHAETATCVDPGYNQSLSDELENGRTIRFARTVETSSADLVLLMDVLEHVDDDVALLQEYWEKARPGAAFLITVPAFEFIWSAHDDYLEHRRRYTIRSLKRTITAAGAVPENLHYYFGAVFPLAAVMRLATRQRAPTGSDMGTLPKPVNALLTAVCGMELHLMKLNRLFGLSVVAYFRKPLE